MALKNILAVTLALSAMASVSPGQEARAQTNSLYIMCIWTADRLCREAAGGDIDAYNACYADYFEENCRQLLP